MCLVFWLVLFKNASPTVVVYFNSSGLLPQWYAFYAERLVIYPYVFPNKFSPFTPGINPA